MAENKLQEPLVLAASARLPYILFGVIVILYGALILYLPFHSPSDIYNSPDEMANVFFIKGIAQDSHIERPAIQQNLPSLVFPRGVLRQDDAFIPVGFVSFPLILGSVAKLIGFKGIFYLIAVLSALSLLAWHSFLRAFFGARVALLTIFLTAGHPLMLYWNNRPFLPNALFMALTFFALYFLVRLMNVSAAFSIIKSGGGNPNSATEQPLTSKIIFAIFAGLILGVTVAIRPQEGIWLSAAVFLIAVFCRFRSWLGGVIFIIAAALPVSGLLVAQKIIYGSAVRTGYHLTPPSLTLLQTLRNFILPFGIDFKLISTVSYNYLLDTVWWLTLPALVGVAIVFLYRNGILLRRLRFWVFVFLAVAVWLMVFYGSFAVQDRFDRAVSLGTSFTRYFLPLHVIVLPFAAYALFYLRRHLGKILIAIMVAVSVIMSMRTVFWGNDESFTRILKSLQQNKEVRAKALQVLPPDAVVLTDRSDKIFFPEREIVSQFRKFHQPDFEKLYGLDLYYETIADAEVVIFENERFWGPHRLKAIKPVDLGYRHSLYKLEQL